MARNAATVRTAHTMSSTNHGDRDRAMVPSRWPAKKSPTATRLTEPRYEYAASLHQWADFASSTTRKGVMMIANALTRSTTAPAILPNQIEPGERGREK